MTSAPDSATFQVPHAISFGLTATPHGLQPHDHVKWGDCAVPSGARTVKPTPFQAVLLDGAAPESLFEF